MDYQVYFRRQDDGVVFTQAEPRDVSLVHRLADGRWHCALCAATHCHHSHAAARADHEAGETRLAGVVGPIFTVRLPGPLQQEGRGK